MHAANARPGHSPGGAGLGREGMAWSGASRISLQAAMQKPGVFIFIFIFSPPIFIYF